MFFDDTIEKKMRNRESRLFSRLKNQTRERVFLDKSASCLHARGLSKKATYACQQRCFFAPTCSGVDAFGIDLCFSSRKCYKLRKISTSLKIAVLGALP